jgi:hypothetical protein
MTTIVAIFDAAEQVDKALERLAGADLEAEVLDENTIAQEPGSIDPVGPALAPGAFAETVTGKEAPNLIPKRDRHAVDRAFRARLKRDYSLPDEAIDAYATTFAHSAKIVVVRTDAKDADRAAEMLRNVGATRVEKHD